MYSIRAPGVCNSFLNFPPPSLPAANIQRGLISSSSPTAELCYSGRPRQDEALTFLLLFLSFLDAISEEAEEEEEEEAATGPGIGRRGNKVY